VNVNTTDATLCVEMTGTARNANGTNAPKKTHTR
jgi:hypothetical protein